MLKTAPFPALNRGQSTVRMASTFSDARHTIERTLKDRYSGDRRVYCFAPFLKDLVALMDLIVMT